MDMERTDDEWAEYLQSLMTGDNEADHSNADAILVKVVRLNYPKTAALFDKVSEDFWYA